MINKIDKNELNCNIFSVYDYDGLSMQDLLSQFFTKINQCIDLSNEAFEITDWLKKQGLKDEVAQKIQSMLDSGVLDTIINTNVYKDLNIKVNYFDNVASMIKKDLPIGSICETSGYYEVNDRGHGRYVIVSNGSVDGGSVILMDNGYKAKLIDSKNINARQFGIIDTTTTQTDKIKKLFKNGGNITFPPGTYIIDDNVMVYENTNVSCETGAIFKLANNTNKKMFLNDFNGNNLGSEITPIYGDFTWNGGVFELNGSNQVLPNWDNLSGAFCLTRFNKVEIRNCVFNDSYGHTINHWGNKTLICDNITFNNKVRLNKLGNMNGGSRSDGITGSSQNIQISNIKGFTDDDMVAVVSGLDWGYGRSKVNTCYIKNVQCTKDALNTWGVWNVLGIYTNKNNFIETLSIENVKGDVNFSFLKTGGGHVKNLNINNVEVSKKSADTYYQTLLQFYEHVQMDNVNISNFKYDNNNLTEEYFLELSTVEIKTSTNSDYSYIKNLYLNDITVNHNITTPTRNKYALIKLTNDVLINNLKGFGSCYSSLNSDYAFLRNPSVSTSKTRVDLSNNTMFINFDFITQNIDNTILNVYNFDNKHPRFSIISNTLKGDKATLNTNVYNKMNSRYCDINYSLPTVSFNVSSSLLTNIVDKVVNVSDKAITVCIKAYNNSQTFSYNTKILTIAPTNNKILDYISFTDMYIPSSYNGGMCQTKLLKTASAIEIYAGQTITDVTYMYFMFTVPLTI